MCVFIHLRNQLGSLFGRQYIMQFHELGIHEPDYDSIHDSATIPAIMYLFMIFPQTIEALETSKRPGFAVRTTFPAASSIRTFIPCNFVLHFTARTFAATDKTDPGCVFMISGSISASAEISCMGRKHKDAVLFARPHSEVHHLSQGGHIVLSFTLNFD